MSGRYANLTEVRELKQPISSVVAVTSLNIDVVTTPILAEIDLSMYDTLAFIFINDGASDYTVTLTTGEVTLAVDSVIAPSILVPAKVGAASGQTMHIVGPDQLRKFWRATGVAATALTAARFALKGFPR